MLRSKLLMFILLFLVSVSFADTIVITPDYSVDVDPSQWLNLPLSIANTGSEEITVTFDVDGDTESWIELSEEFLDIQAGTSENISAIILVPENPVAEDYTNQIVASWSITEGENTTTYETYSWLNISLLSNPPNNPYNNPYNYSYAYGPVCRLLVEFTPDPRINQTARDGDYLTIHALYDTCNNIYDLGEIFINSLPYISPVKLEGGQTYQLTAKVPFLSAYSYPLEVPQLDLCVVTDIEPEQVGDTFKINNVHKCGDVTETFSYYQIYLDGKKVNDGFSIQDKGNHKVSVCTEDKKYSCWEKVYNDITEPLRAMQTTPEPKVGKDVSFIVSGTDADKVGWTVLDSKEITTPLSLETSSTGNYIVTYKPEKAGDHKLLAGNKQIASFTVESSIELWHILVIIAIIIIIFLLVLYFSLKGKSSIAGPPFLPMLPKNVNFGPSHRDGIFSDLDIGGGQGDNP